MGAYVYPERHRNAHRGFQIPETGECDIFTPYYIYTHSHSTLENKLLINVATRVKFRDIMLSVRSKKRDTKENMLRESINKNFKKRLWC